MTELLLLGFAGAAFLVSAKLASLLCAAVLELLPTKLARSSRLCAALALMPVAVGAAVALSLVSLPIGLGACHCAAHTHHAHLCFRHAAFTWSIALVGGAGLFGLAANVPAILRVVTDFRRTASWARHATAMCPRLRVEVAGELGMRAVTVGLFKVRILLGADLWAKLDEPGRAAIVAHERAHVARRDPLTLFCLRLATCLLPRAAGETLLAAWRRAAEIACDRAAADAVGDPLLLASTLVTCGRLQLGQSPLDAPGSLAAVDDDHIEERVRSLVEAPRGQRVASLRGDLPFVLCGLVVVAVAFTRLGAPTAHHAAETLLGWLA